MSVPYLREAVEAGETEKLIRFMRLHLGYGNEAVGKKENDKSPEETIKFRLRYEPADLEFIENTLRRDDATLALLYFHLRFQ
jgi:hypothetical protein